ncbi:hypothetical protein FDF74_11685 [Clostridium niameyense]|uniref:Uncharacterized protein n=1 Tax=Clostridium niameyense TaxID=1622073 RepID=A0A6M0RCE6_9CLOT|nr:hypothetical protein [Clostridium niameyense]NEZ47842.1 hypothetical protein [Clostridium niameyense]
MQVLQKHDFNNLDIQDQVSYINNLLQQGNTITATCKLIGIARSTIGGRFTKAGYSYNEGLHKYCKSNINAKIKPKEIVLDEHYKSNANASIENNEVALQKQYNNNNAKVLQQLEGIMPTLVEMLEWYKTQKNIVEIKPIELNLDYKELSGAISTHSFKCYEEVFKEFNRVCSKYKGYKKQDLVSLALLDFINKYKK